MEQATKSDAGVAHLGPGQGRATWVLGTLVTRKATGEQTGGAYSLFEATVRPHEGVPPHIQHRDDECFYVLEGDFEFSLGEPRIKAGPGALIYIPKGNVHAFKNVGSETGRLLFSQTPGGLHERFFEEIGEEAKDPTTPPLMDGPPDFERISAIGAKYGIEMLPPVAE